MSVPKRLREIFYRFSNLIAFAIVAALMLWLSPGSDFLRDAGVKDDLIRMSMLAVAVIPAFVGGFFIRLFVAAPDQTAKSSN
ncbi:hypothetical protein [Pseudomonas aeruginosa]|uniref:hypothetical protein n=1 Tax=Pseudomonas aeruginosa TaxID=287 RepID=UPI000EB5DB73|nr:hypothetical protein [Pseudomonas aeruginosa]